MRGVVRRVARVKSQENRAKALMLVPDLYFATRILATAKRLAVDVESVSDAKVRSRCLEAPPSVLIVDLEGQGDPLSVIRDLKAAPETASVRIVAFYSHVLNALRLSALAAGADLVLPRSAFTAKLPELLAEVGRIAN